jgi:NADP-dependent 3-hydroxy acid dehydrogenase YdfG
MGWLDGKRALVAGAGSGIGRAVLAAFVSEGAQVGALELDPPKAARLAAELPDCVTARGDATVMADARAAVEAVTSSFGGLDVLVNCVGIFDFYRGLADIADDQLDAAFDEMFAVNVKSQLVTVRATLPQLRRAGGSVVLTVSTSGFYPGRGGVLYVASKFAVRGFTYALREDLLGRPIHLTTVDPGLVETNFSRVRFRGDEEKAAAVYANVEPVRPEDVADCVVFVLTRPPHVNIDELVVKALAQSTPVKIVRTT